MLHTLESYPPLQSKHYSVFDETNGFFMHMEGEFETSVGKLLKHRNSFLT